MTKPSFDPWLAVTDSLAFIKGNAGRVFIWGLLMYLPLLLMFLALMPIYIAAFSAGMEGQSPDDMSVAAALTMNAVSGLAQVLQFVVLIPVYAAIGFMMWARPRAKTWLGLRFGMDEVRVLLIFLAIVAGACVAIMLAAIVISLIVVPVAMASKPAAVLVAIPLVAAALAAVIWAAIRASLIIPATLDKGDFAFVEGWKASKGRFWPLLGTYLLAILMSILISVLFFFVVAILVVIGLVIVAAATGGQLDQASSTLLIGLGVPAGILYFVCVAALGGAQVVLTQGPWYSVWKQLHHIGNAPVEAQPEPTAQL